MKIRSNTCILNRAMALVAVSMFMFSCEPSVDANQPTPKFNEQFLGSYNVMETIICYGSPEYCNDTFNVVVEVMPGSTDSSISFLNHTDIELSQSTQGWFGYAYHYSITFRNDSIFSYFTHGNPETGTYENHIGKKQ